MRATYRDKVRHTQYARPITLNRRKDKM